MRENALILILAANALNKKLELQTIGFPFPSIRLVIFVYSSACRVNMIFKWFPVCLIQKSATQTAEAPAGSDNTELLQVGFFNFFPNFSFTLEIKT